MKERSRNKKKSFLETFGYYQKSIDKLASYNLDDSPAIKDLELSSGQTQQVYKDIENTNFNGTLQEYLGYLSARFILAKMKPKLSLLKESEYRSGEKEFVLICAEDPTNAVNLVKLCIRRFDVFFRVTEEEGIPTWLAANIFTVLGDIHRHIVLKQRGQHPLEYFKALQKNPGIIDRIIHHRENSAGLSAV